MTLIDSIKKYIQAKDIEYVHISNGFSDKNFLNLEFPTYKNEYKNTLFIGMYKMDDYIKIKKHIGNCHILWWANDSIINETKKKLLKIFENKDNLYHIAKDTNVQKNLSDYIKIPLISNFNFQLDQEYKVSVILPTLNRLDGFKNVVNQILSQSYKNIELVIVDDGSKKNIFNQKKNFVNNLNDRRIKFLKNDINLKLPFTINKGIKNCSGDYITWISDDNTYYDIFIEKLISNNDGYDLIYSDFELFFQNQNYKKIVKNNFSNLNDVISNYGGLASFMYSKKLIDKIGLYDENLYKTEDYEYLLRIFNDTNTKIKYVPEITMTYLRHSESIYSKNEFLIKKMTSDINSIYKIIHNLKDKKLFLYYSKFTWTKLFQRPHQIMRFMDKTLLKVFITSDDIVEFEEDNNLLIINYKYKDIIFNNFKDITIYYTDSRLYNEIVNYKCIKVYDLIDAPISEFEIWKSNLNNCVKNSDHVIYSHPDLVNFLNEIDNTKQYTYISNACDYKHFSSAKDRIGERPADFLQIDKPILGYYGAFSEWLDYDIIRKYADEGIYHVVMIGGIQGNVKYNMRFEHANITWLDHKPYDELPYYLSWFDKCFLPFKDCELTKYVNPCKLWEYMVSEKEIIKHNVNMNVDEIVTYDDVCKKIQNLFNNTNNLYDNINLDLSIFCTNLQIYENRRPYLTEIISKYISKNFEFNVGVNGFSKCMDQFVLTKFQKYNNFEIKHIFPKQRFISAGELGATESFINAIKRAKELKKKYCLLLEDDITIHHDLKYNLNNILKRNKKYLSNFKLLYIGASPDNGKIITKINNDISFCNGFINGVFGVIINSDIFDIIIEIYKKDKYCIFDVDILCVIQSIYSSNCFILNKMLIKVDDNLNYLSFNRDDNHYFNSSKIINSKFTEFNTENLKPYIFPKKFNIPKNNAFSNALHRYGWKKVSSYMYDMFHDDSNNIIIDESIETTFGWKSCDNKNPYNKPWIGFSHGLLRMPDWYDSINSPENYVRTKKFNDSLLHCKGIYVLSLELKDFFTEYFKEVKLDIKVNFIYHPIEIDENIKKFDINRLTSKLNPVFIGWWGRKFETIYKLAKYAEKNDDLDLVTWLNGGLEINRLNMYLQYEINENINFEKLEKLKILKVSNEEYDIILQNNYIIIDLYNSTANNAVLEGIMYNTPMLISNNNGVKAYLGKNYPGYYENYEDLINIIKDKNLLVSKLRKCYNYLKVMNKDFLSFNFFKKSIIFSDIYNDL